MDLWCFVSGVAPAPFCVASLFSLPAKRKSGREICVSSLLPCFLFCWVFSMVCLVCEAKGFHNFCTLLYRFSHCQDRALERDRPQQRKKKLRPPKTQIETQKWCQFLSPSLDTICLPRDAISKYINHESSMPG